MKRIMLVAVLLAGSFSAEAVVQVFFTSSAKPYGLTNPVNAFNASVGTQDVTSGAYQVSAFPPFSEGPDFELIAPPLGEFVYAWLRFVDEPLDARVVGLHLVLTGSPADIAYYVVDETGTLPPRRRWDGPKGPTPPAALFKQNPQILASPLGGGITNTANALAAWNLYDPATRTALLGAVQMNLIEYRHDLELGATGLGYAGGPPPIVQLGSFGIPEPSTAMLCAAVLVPARKSR